MEFLTPQHSLWAILGLSAWIFGYFYFLKKPQLYLPKRFSSAMFSFPRALVLILGIVAWSFIAFSLSTPRRPMGFAQNQIEVNDIFFVVDVSHSMLAEDFSPNRLEAAKSKILDFVNLRPTDRIGIVMFSEKAFTLLPLTTDLKLVRQMVSEISVGFLGSGTNIGDALALAVARGAQSLAKSKIVVLLTDGVSNVGTLTPTQAAQEAKDQGIKVYTIGIGGNKNARIPVGRGAFGRQHYSTIPGGSFDRKVLSEIAQITGAKSYVAQDVGILKNVLLEIEKLERTKIDSSSKILYEELYYKYLLIGVLLLILVEILRRLLLREGE